MEIKNLVSIEYFIEDWKPVILIVSRDDKKEKVIQEIRNFRPYIYSDLKDAEIIKQAFMRDIYSSELSEKEYLFDNEKQLVKITLQNPLSVYKIKKHFQTYESDILFTNKFVIDNVDKIESEDLRINFLDIETTSIQGFPHYLNPVEKIISLVCYDNYLDKYILWIWHKSYNTQLTNEQVEAGDGMIDVEIRRFDTEENMLNNYLDFMQETKPDFVTSWNVGFDIPYLIARLQQLKLDAQKMSPLYATYKNKFRNGLVEWKDGPGVYGKRFGNREVEKNVQIKGLYYFDLLTAYKNIVAKELASFSLDAVAEREKLSSKKLKTHFDIGEKWEKDPHFIEKYNFIDVYLIKELNKKMGIIKRYITIRDMCFLSNINDVFSTGRVLDSYILKLYKDQYVFPSKHYDMNDRGEVAAGYVRPQIPGIYENAVVFDFKGCYPNLIKTFNLSTEKLMKEDVLYMDRTADETPDVRDIMDEKMYRKEDNLFTYRIRTNKYKANLTYKLDEKGVLTKAVSGLMNLRQRYKSEKKLAKDKYGFGSVEYERAFNQEFSMKFLINGVYGACAYPGFRLFNPNNANAITALAREAIKWVGFRLEEKGWKILYNDTDSTFVQLYKSNTLEENLKEIEEEAYPLIQNALDEFALKYLPEEFVKDSTLEMEMKEIYSKLMLVGAKKRYDGILKYTEGGSVENKDIDSRFVLMGLDAKKSNTIKLSANAQIELAKALLTEQDWKSVIIKYYNLVLASQDIELFKISSKLEKPQEEYASNTPAKRASLWSNANIHTSFRAGTKFFIIRVEEKTCGTNCVAFEEPSDLGRYSKEFKLDKDYYLEDLYNKFYSLIGRIPAFGDYNEQIYKRYKAKNRSLEEWF